MRPLSSDLDRQHILESAFEAEHGICVPEHAGARRFRLWLWLELLAWQMPLTPAKVSAVLGVPLQRQENGSFGYRARDAAFHLSGEQALGGVELVMADAGNGSWRELTLEVGAACTVAQLRRRHGSLYLSHLPLDDDRITAYLSCQCWGTLSFAFRHAGPTELFRMTLRPC